MAGKMSKLLKLHASTFRFPRTRGKHDQAIDIARDISILEARAHDAEGDQR
jgi:hypothetical protein